MEQAICINVVVRQQTRDREYACIKIHHSTPIKSLCGEILGTLPEQFGKYECQFSLKWKDKDGHGFLVDVLQLKKQSFENLRVSDNAQLSISLLRQTCFDLFAIKPPRESFKRERWFLERHQDTLESAGSPKKLKLESSNVCDDHGHPEHKIPVGRRKQRSLSEIISCCHTNESLKQSRGLVSDLLSKSSDTLSNDQNCTVQDLILSSLDSVDQFSEECGPMISAFFCKLASQEGIINFARSFQIHTSKSVLYSKQEKTEKQNAKKGQLNLLKNIEKRIYSEGAKDELTEILYSTVSERRTQTPRSLVCFKEHCQDYRIIERIQKMIEDPDGLQTLLAEATQKTDCKD